MQPCFGSDKLCLEPAVSQWHGQVGSHNLSGPPALFRHYSGIIHAWTQFILHRGSCLGILVLGRYPHYCGWSVAMQAATSGAQCLCQPDFLGHLGVASKQAACLIRLAARASGFLGSVPQSKRVFKTLLNAVLATRATKCG